MKLIAINLGSTGTLFIILWTFITGWEYNISCKVNEETRELSQTFEKLTCECVARCQWESCDDLINQGRTGPCCSTGYCRRQSYKDYQLCQVGPVYHTTVHLGLITEDNHTAHTTLTKVTYQGYDTDSYLNKPWPCHYIHSFVNYAEHDVYPEDADNKTWPIVLVCILGLFLVPVWIISMINCPFAVANLCMDLISKWKPNVTEKPSNEKKNKQDGPIELTGAKFVAAWNNPEITGKQPEVVIQLPETPQETFRETSQKPIEVVIPLPETFQETSQEEGIPVGRTSSELSQPEGTIVNIQKKVPIGRSSSELSLQEGLSTHEMESEEEEPSWIGKSSNESSVNGSSTHELLD